jgi:hypothetical protein
MVLSADVFAALGLPQLPLPRGSVAGIGGVVPSFQIHADIHVLRDRGAPAALHGPFVAFTDPNALDISAIGRDLLNYFALIVDWQRSTVCLLNQRHGYRIMTV